MIGILHLGGFVLCQFLLSFSYNSEAQPAGCTWIPFPNTLIYGGNGTNSASTVAACQSLCTTTSWCLSIDFDSNNKCFLSSTTAGKVSNMQGVTHYDLNCPGSGCQWTRYANMNIYGGTQNSATSLVLCQAVCVITPNCLSIDWAYAAQPGSQCYLVQTQSGKSSFTGVDHYDLIGCSVTFPNGIPSSSATNIPGVSVTSMITQAQTNAASAGCSWTLFANTLIYGGNGTNSAATVADCQALCWAVPWCLSIDFDSNNKCFLSSTTAGKVSNVPGVNHYDLNCSGSNPGGSRPAGGQPGVSVSTQSPASVCVLSTDVDFNTSSVGGIYISEITSEADCFMACKWLPRCLGFDLSGPNNALCWLHFNLSSFSQQYFQLNVVQYTFIRCLEDDSEYCKASYDTSGAINDSCATVCHPSWIRLENIAGNGSGAWVNTSDLGNCLQHCANDSNCAAVEIYDQPWVQSACKYYYFASDSAALLNIKYMPFVTQYTNPNGCATTCNITWDRWPQTRVRLLRATRNTAITSEADCLKACLISPTCEAAEFRSVVMPGCTLAEEYIPKTWTPDSAAVTYVYREICPAKPTLWTTPAPGMLSSRSSR